MTYLIRLPMQGEIGEASPKIHAFPLHVSIGKVIVLWWVSNNGPSQGLLPPHSRSRAAHRAALAFELWEIFRASRCPSFYPLPIGPISDSSPLLQKLTLIYS